MNPEYKQRWIEALESGEYRQTSGHLHDEEGGYCCLGVLCKAAGATFYGDNNIGEPSVELNGVELKDEDEELLSFTARKLFGLSYNEQVHLAELNDGSNAKKIPPHSFEQIAKIIREKF
jgi:hypothetical protein